MAQTHGKSSTYNRGCRCDECTAAARDRMRKRREYRRSDRIMSPDERAYFETEPEFFHARLRAQS